MPRRQRDYRAEYAARQARAQQQGYRSYAEQRQRRAQGRPTPRDPVAHTMRPVQTPAGRIAGSGSPEAIIREIRRAAQQGESIAIQATFDAGRGPRTRYIDKVPAGGLAAAGRGSSAIGGPVAPHQGLGTASPVQIISGPAVTAGGAGGIPAQFVLDWIDEYEFDEDPWAWLADLWDIEY